MHAKVYSHIQLIGTAQLQVGDKAMGHVYGEFLPIEAYYENIRAHILEFQNAVVHDFAAVDLLQIIVVLENGYFLFPRGGITFVDYPGEPLQIDIAGIDFHVIEDFFSNSPKPFVEGPWECISIERKIAFEDELKKELGVESDITRLQQDMHVLEGYTFSALCKSCMADDVLFSVSKPDFSETFALVHLTWKGRKEISNYPYTEFYESFDAFKELRMYPDKANWED